MGAREGKGEMPHETIHAEEFGHGLQISWGRDAGYVQVGTTYERSPFAFSMDGKPALWVEGEPPQQLFRGWFAQFNRAQINDAIRLLRRARDQAFGRDE